MYGAILVLMLEVGEGSDFDIPLKKCDSSLDYLISKKEKKCG